CTILCHSLVVVRTPSFFFDGPAPAGIYALSLHDALPICPGRRRRIQYALRRLGGYPAARAAATEEVAEPVYPLPPERDWWPWVRSEEHTSELQSRGHLVCRLLLEKKNKRYTWNLLRRSTQ